MWPNLAFFIAAKKMCKMEPQFLRVTKQWRAYECKRLGEGWGVNISGDGEVIVQGVR